MHTGWHVIVRGNSCRLPEYSYLRTLVSGIYSSSPVRWWLGLSSPLHSTMATNQYSPTSLIFLLSFTPTVIPVMESCLQRLPPPYTFPSMCYSAPQASPVFSRRSGVWGYSLLLGAVSPTLPSVSKKAKIPIVPFLTTFPVLHTR